MKKILGIIILSLLFSGNAYAEEITLKKCHWSFEDKLAKQKREAWYFLINESKKTINNVKKYKKSYVKKFNDKYKSKGKYRMRRIYITEYKLTYIDDDYAKGESEFLDIIIDLNDKTVQMEAITLNCR